MEQLQFGDIIHWATVNGSAYGKIEKVIDERTLGVRMPDGGLMRVSLHSIKKVEKHGL